MEETPAQGAQPAPQQPTPATSHKKFSPKTLILIIILAVIAGVLIFFAISMNSSQSITPQANTNNQAQLSPTAMVEKTAIASFSPSTVNIATSSSVSVDIIITAGNTPITGAQVQLKYDPTVVKNPKISAPDATNSLFGTSASYIELFNEVDQTNGTVTYAIGTQANGNPVVGSGSIGKLTFSVVKGTNPSTQITFGDDTAVTKKGVDESVLNSTTPLTVILQ